MAIRSAITCLALRMKAAMVASASRRSTCPSWSSASPGPARAGRACDRV